MVKSLSQLVWESFNKMTGILGFIFTLLIAILLWIFSPDSKISFYIILPILLILIIIIVTSINALIVLNNNRSSMPKIIMCKKSNNANKYPLIILTPSELFSYGSLVSIYFKEEYFERLIGIGSIQIIQDDGHIQVEFSMPNPEFIDIIDSMISNDLTILNKIIVKPSIPNNFIKNQIEVW